MSIFLPNILFKKQTKTVDIVVSIILMVLEYYILKYIFVVLTISEEKIYQYLPLVIVLVVDYFFRKIKVGELGQMILWNRLITEFMFKLTFYAIIVVIVWSIALAPHAFESFYSLVIN